ncbi:hypothetical protein [Microbacterium sp. RU33B]|uniref:hypothetical protein n=1 Tax=Microbacterium sp. RU33B TaxID=1907390 RepID=UPI000966211B|nr:hypothetical protein [Microbacterium sp. RU33B]SIT89090.1 hypothetical protein SAMN05880545_3122 [Microbacterium sp. RU33B]
MAYSRGVRWDRFFEDLEDQVASEWEAERAALDTEAERLRLSKVGLRARLEALAATSVSIEFVDGTVVSAEVSGVGADWVALAPQGARSAAIVAPLAGVVSIAMPHADVLRSARPPVAARSPLADRLTFGYLLRDLVRRRTAVAIQLAHGRLLTGTVDRAGVDHLDIALHEPGSPRRTSEVTGHRLVPFAAVAWVRIDGGVDLL